MPATYKTVTEQVLVQRKRAARSRCRRNRQRDRERGGAPGRRARRTGAATTFKTHTDQFVTREATQRVEVLPPVYRTEPTRVVDVPEHTIQRVVPAVFKEVEETVLVNPATTRTEAVPARYRTEVERVLVRPEVVQYLPVRLPMRPVAEQRLRAEAHTRVEALPPIMRTVVEPVEVRPATVRKAEVPAAYEIVTEQVKVSEPYREWRRGRAWVGQAIEVVPLRGFVVDPSGQFKGYNVAGRSLVPAATGGASLGVIDIGATPADNRQLEDDVWCLVEVPAQYQTVQRQVLRPRPPPPTSPCRPANTRTSPSKSWCARPCSAWCRCRRSTTACTGKESISSARGRRLQVRPQRVELVATPAASRWCALPPWPASRTCRSTARWHPTPGCVKCASPAEYKNVNRYVPEQAAGVRVVEVAPAYRTIKRRVEVQPARTESVVVPATYKTVNTQVLVRAEAAQRACRPSCRPSPLRAGPARQPAPGAAARAGAAGRAPGRRARSRCARRGGARRLPRRDAPGGRSTGQHAHGRRAGGLSNAVLAGQSG